MQADGVERFAGGFDVYFAQHGLDAIVFQGEPIADRLGNRLDREFLSAVANLVDMSEFSKHAETPVQQAIAESMPCRARSCLVDVTGTCID